MIEKVPAHFQTLAFFFAAAWCPHSRAFTPDLRRFYREVKGKKGKNATYLPIPVVAN